MRVFPVILLLALFTPPLHAQLSAQIARIAAEARGRVGVACAVTGKPLPGQPLNCGLHPADALPMQSVYKLPIAVAALHAVEQGRLSLTQTLRFVPSNLVARDGYSPLRDQHPRGAVSVSVEELLRRSLVDSDNVASDVLLQAVGGPAAAEQSLRNLDLDGIAIRDSENTVDRDEHLQYRNAASPQALVNLLVRLAGRSPLTPAHTALLLGWMAASHTGDGRIPALLPPGTPVAGKTGTAGQHRPFMNATNEIALITLPGGRKLALAVLIADSAAPFPMREHVIAQIARAVYNAATHGLTADR